MRINGIQSTSFGKIYRVTSNTENPNPRKVNPDVYEAVMDARGTISGLRKKEPKDKEASRALGEYLKAQIPDWDGRVNGLALAHIKGSDYMFTGEDADRFFKYRKESGQIAPDDMLYEKTQDFLKNLRRSKVVLKGKINECDQALDAIGVIPALGDEENKEYYTRKKERYADELKVVENHIDSLVAALKDNKYSYQAAYQRGKHETMIESGDFDEISFRFGEYGEISSVEFLSNDTEQE